MSIKIIDVSHHQGNIDFAKVKASGVGGVILKATEGVNYTDPNFTAYAQAATAAGLPIGAYHFLRSTPVEQQAADFLTAIKPYKCFYLHYYINTNIRPYDERSTKSF